MASFRDIALLRACQRQEPKAQAAFYSFYKRRLMGVCRRYARSSEDAEDIFQEAFVKIFTTLSRLQKEESVDHWVKSIVIKTAVDFYRATWPQRQQVELAESHHELAGEDWSILDKLEAEEVMEVINRLPDGFRLVINLHLLDGYTHAQVAALLGISIGTSKSQLSRGREALRQELARMGIIRYENE